MSLKNKEILIIDDDQDLVVFLTKIVEVKKMRVSSAKDLSEAQEILSKKIPHIILLDLKLNKNENGISYLKTLRADDRTKDIPIIIMTRSSTKENIAKAISFGASDLIAKPLSSTGLLQKIKKQLKEFKYPKIDLRDHPDNACHISCEGSIKKISEITAIIKSPIKFDTNSKLEIKSVFLRSINYIYQGIKTIGISHSKQDGYYTAKISFTGVPESEAKKIRLLKFEAED